MTLRLSPMRLLRGLMLGLCGSLAYAAVMGKGGWLRYQDLRHQWQVQQEINQVLSRRNETLRAEVRDLKSGSEAVEEIARSELGMVRPNEVYYQYWPARPRLSGPVR